MALIALLRGAMADQGDSHESGQLPSVEHLTPEEANRIIHSHRKVRYGTW